MITHRRWSKLAVGLLLILSAACQAGAQEETRVAARPPAFTPRPSPTLPATPTAPPSPTATSRPTPTPTPVPVRPLPSGWQQFGNELYGLQVAAPGSWVDATESLRNSQAIDRFGPQMLLLANSAGTVERLLTGVSLGEGAYIFGFTGDLRAVTGRPTATIRARLSEWREEPLPSAEPKAISFGDVSGAYVDLDSDPFGAFSSENPRRYRVLMLVEPGSQSPAFFVLGTDADNWDAYEKMFSAMMETITFPETNATILGHLTGGEPVEGSLERERLSVWTFNGQTGRYATITLRPIDRNVDPTLRLVDPAGKTVATVDNGYAGDAEVLTDILLTADGTYLVEASEFFNEAGRYELSLMLSDEPEFGGGGLIDYGRELTSELSENAEHSWSFEGTAGQDITVILTSLNEQLDLILELQGPDGRTLATIDEGFAGDTEILNGFELPVIGEYTIRVRGFAGHGGLYTLSLDEGKEATGSFYDAGNLAYGDSKRELLREEEAHAWFFNGSAGDNVMLEVTPLEEIMDLDVWLLDPGLHELVMKDETLSGEAETVEQILPADGQYLILVREFFGESGEYEIELNISSDEALESAGILAYGDSVTGVLPAGKRIGWGFEGQAEDVIDVLLGPSAPERDLVMILLDPSGNPAITVDAALSGLPEHLVDFTLTADGQWTIVVQEFFNEGAGYELTLTKIEP